MPDPGLTGEGLILAAWTRYQNGEEEAIEEAYEEALPFCLKVAARTCGRYVSKEDDEASVAYMAFLEAFSQYEPERGRFYLYLGRVVRSRVIDFHRREKKQRSIPFSALLPDDDFEVADESAIEEILQEMARKQEIQKLAGLLQGFDISFADLVEVSPKHWRVRETAKEAGWQLAGDEEMMAYLLKTGNLPLKMLVEKGGFKRKSLERHRKFVIAVSLIVYHDFDYLRSYVRPVKRRG
ncbi:MAG: hypothetical protein GX964_05390 [Syntrophomonadaceae bacterium]|nr:hypothetical protein [Syntrophomonadaceae bacterium]